MWVPPSGTVAEQMSPQHIQVLTVPSQFSPRGPVPTPQPKANADVTGASGPVRKGPGGMPGPGASVTRTTPGPHVSVERQLPCPKPGQSWTRPRSEEI